MPLPSPNLDDRDFNQLVEEARRHIAQACPDWTDLSPNDPGMVLLEMFAYLTEAMIYRLNRVPEKMYIEFLRLIGIQLQPPAAAGVNLVFSRARAEDPAVQISRGTRVTLNRSGSTGEALIFATDADVTIPQGETQAEVLAHHCDVVEGEFAGVGTGLPNLVIKAQRPPFIAPTGDKLDLVVGVEAEPAELSERSPAIEFEDKTYRVWREVENFTNVGDDPYVYLVDRMSGIITFAPAARLEQRQGELADSAQALAALPGARREIRLWYRRGGGPEGNVETNTLTQLKDAITGIEVTNPSPAVGGRAPETLENALVRGPQQLHSLRRAVTARDFEMVVLHNSQAIARAKALTQAALWSYATPGTVEVLLVPYIPPEKRREGQLTMAMLQEYQTEEAQTSVQQALDERRPLGTACLANWARYKTVRVKARIVVRRVEDLQAVRQRVIERLYQTINPLPTQFSSTGWLFGQALRASHVYDMALAEPGVRWVDQVQLVIDEVPDGNVTALVADATQPRTWYAGCGSTLFRSLNDGESWEVAGRFTDEEIILVQIHSGRAGLVAAATQLSDSSGSNLHISWDCAETWDATPYSFGFQIQGMAWTLRAGEPVLLMASSVGLYELSMQPGSSPVQVLVDPARQTLGFYSVVTSTDASGGVNVAVAAQDTRGVYLSSTGGATGTFRYTGLRGEDVRQLVVQQDGPRSFLWAGSAVAGGTDPGKGCATWELRGSQDPPEGWQRFGKNWTGGTCHAITFVGKKVLASSHRSGVLQVDLHARDASWQASDVGCGLPLRDPGRFHPVLTMAANPEARLVLAGGIRGVFRSDDEGQTYTASSKRVFSDKVMLPATWLFVSGEHDIAVVSEDETE
ncbi:MAG TPA: baseplate J/gp47 family protein [Ktedonobacteraceae bacterium]|nr:baseplate J/gp47 family protein [Ktedonobacteraceae bacterium]